MKKTFLLFITVLLLGALMVACSDKKENATDKDTPPKEVTVDYSTNVDKLTGDRPDAKTMELAGTPPLQPSNHEGRWDPKKGAQGCADCHGGGTSGIKTIPASHYVDGKKDKGIAYQSCTLCHGLTEASTPGYQSGKENK